MNTNIDFIDDYTDLDTVLTESNFFEEFNKFCFGSKNWIPYTSDFVYLGFNPETEEWKCNTPEDFLMTIPEEEIVLKSFFPYCLTNEGKPDYVAQKDFFESHKNDIINNYNSVIANYYIECINKGMTHAEKFYKDSLKLDDTKSYTYASDNDFYRINNSIHYTERATALLYYKDYLEDIKNTISDLEKWDYRFSGSLYDLPIKPNMICFEDYMKDSYNNDTFLESTKYKCDVLDINYDDLNKQVAENIFKYDEILEDWENPVSDKLYDIEYEQSLDSKLEMADSKISKTQEIKDINIER